jgi:hypothetical protein
MRGAFLGMALVAAVQLRSEPTFERVALASLRQYATSA